MLVYYSITVLYCYLFANGGNVEDVQKIRVFHPSLQVFHRQSTRPPHRAAGGTTQRGARPPRRPQRPGHRPPSDVRGACSDPRRAEKAPVRSPAPTAAVCRHIFLAEAGHARSLATEFLGQAPRAPPAHRPPAHRALFPPGTRFSVRFLPPPLPPCPPPLPPFPALFASPPFPPSLPPSCGVCVCCAQAGPMYVRQKSFVCVSACACVRVCVRE